MSKQVALAFAKRTIAKCKKFEGSGASCFNEPGLRDVIFAPPPKIKDAEPLDGVSTAAANRMYINYYKFELHLILVVCCLFVVLQIQCSMIFLVYELSPFNLILF